MEDQVFLISAVLFLALLQFALHWFLKWRLRIDPAVQQKPAPNCSPAFLGYRGKLSTACRIQSHIGVLIGPWFCMFLSVMSTDAPDHPAYAPVLVASVTATVSYLLFLELPLQATRQWALQRNATGICLSVANIILNLWFTPFWIVLPFQAYFLARMLHSSRKQKPGEAPAAPDSPV